VNVAARSQDISESFDMADALALIELDSIASGLWVLDRMIKRAPIEVCEANLVEPGKFLILYSGGVAEVEEAQEAALSAAEGSCIQSMLLPFAHPSLLAGLRGAEVKKSADGYDCLGVIETVKVSGTLVACDRSLKDAAVDLVLIRVQGGLAGRAYFVFHGKQHDVEAAIQFGAAAAEEHGGLHRKEVIPRPHAEMVEWILRPAPFQLRSR
jgi:microcompartment protein CcmL/EutN